jgi:hypothetical protein
MRHFSLSKKTPGRTGDFNNKERRTTKLRANSYFGGQTIEYIYLCLSVVLIFQVC